MLPTILQPCSLRFTLLIKTDWFVINKVCLIRSNLAFCVPLGMLVIINVLCKGRLNTNAHLHTELRNRNCWRSACSCVGECNHGYMFLISAPRHKRCPITLLPPIALKQTRRHTVLRCRPSLREQTRRPANLPKELTPWTLTSDEIPNISVSQLSKFIWKYL